MLKDVIAFVQSRTGITDRATALREIQFAWREIWNIDDLPNSLFEITLKPIDNTSRVVLPYYVGRIRGIKTNNGRIRVNLNTPRALYQTHEYTQSPFTWEELGTTPLKTSILNATTLDLTLAEEEAIQVTATLIGPTDNAAEDREQIVFAPGETTKQTTKRFTDLTSATKDKLTLSDLVITGGNAEDLGFIPNCDFEARNIIVQIMDKCNTCVGDCACFDILYKRTPPLLYYDESFIPNGYDEVLMTKTVEWIMLPKEGKEKTALLFAEKSKALLMINNDNDNQNKEIRLDLGTNNFCSRYHGYL